MPMSETTSIVIADDHSIFRRGLREVIEQQPDLKVVAESCDGNGALEVLRQLRPQIAILDIDMPDLDGFAVARKMAKETAAVQIIFLTMYKDELHLSEALNLGAKGYLVKEAAAHDVVTCIRAVSRGETYVSPTVSVHLVHRAKRSSELIREVPELETLTRAERQVFLLLADCKTSKDIATDLGVSTRTVENHRAKICEKLDLHGPHALVKFALQHKGEL